MHTTMKKTGAFLLALTLLLGICTLAPKTALAAVAGDFTITLTGGGEPQESTNLIAADGDYFWDGGDSVLYIHSATPMTIKNNDPNVATGHRIRVSDTVTANITLEGVNIEAPGGNSAFWLGNNATATITLVRDNTLTGGSNCAGLLVPPTATLTITSSTRGSLTAKGGAGGAGGGGSAGIGGGMVDNSGRISITGNADVTATGGAGIGSNGGGAGIGGGGGDQAGGDAGTITIGPDATVKATGGAGDNGGGKGATIGYGGAGGGSNPDGKVKYTLVPASDSRDSYTLEFLRLTLVNKQFGVTVSGDGIAEISRLIVQANKLHAAGACKACDEIRRRNPLAVYDISLTHGHTGSVDVFIPFSGSTGSYTVLHCNNGTLEEQSAPYQSGGVTTTWKKLSPFAVVQGANVSVPQNLVVDPPKTGTGGYGMAGVALLLCALVAGVLVRKRRI